MKWSRHDALRRLCDGIGDDLRILDRGVAWPARGELNLGAERIPVDVYLGVLGRSHRGRERAERRMQNPSRDLPVAHSPGHLPILLGLAIGESAGDDLLVAWDPTTRFGKRTRVSYFVSVGLLEEAARVGYAARQNSAGETLIAFRPAELRRYCRERLAAVPAGQKLVTHSHRDSPSTGYGSMALLEQLARLIGVESVEALAQKIAAALASTVEANAANARELVVALARREGVLGPADDDLTPAAALAALGSLDGRIAFMAALVQRLGFSPSVGLSHEEFVRRLFEDERFVGKVPKGDLAEQLLAILARCEPGTDKDDLELFLDNSQPSLFFYETVQAYVESLGENAAGVDDDDDDVDDEDDDLEPLDQPVRASVKTMSVRSLFEMVQEKELDIEPAWQRTDVWSLKKKRELIKSLLLGIPLPSIILHSRSGRMSIIDGKQRLLSIVKYLANEFKLPNFAVRADSPLYACRGAFYEKAGKASLSDEVRRSLRLKEIPALLFEEVPEARLRSIFHLYNVAGTKLNAAEIRNAVYQANPIHRALFVLAGEGRARVDLGIGGLEIQDRFKNRLRSAYPGARRRYQGVDFLARYLGYSRAVQADESKPFTHPSTSAAINSYFDHGAAGDAPAATAREIVEAFDAAEKFFDVSDTRLAFYTRGADGKRKFSKLAATTHMVAARFLLDLIATGKIAEADAMAAAEAVAVEAPTKQQSATIWDFQARVLLGLRDHLGAAEATSSIERWRRFFVKMEFCRLPPEFGED